MRHRRDEQTKTEDQPQASEAPSTEQLADATSEATSTEQLADATTSNETPKTYSRLESEYRSVLERAAQMIDNGQHGAVLTFIHAEWSRLK